MAAFKNLPGVAICVFSVYCILGAVEVGAVSVRVGPEMSSDVDGVPMTIEDLIDVLRMDGLQWDELQWDDLHSDDPQWNNLEASEKKNLKELITILRLFVAIGKENFECSCSGISCKCCHHIDISYFAFKLKGDVCLHAKLELQRLGFVFTLTFGGKTIYKHEISAKKPPPLCFPFWGANVCVQFHNINFGRGKFSACTKIIFYYWGITVYTLDLGCFGLKALSQNGTDAFQIEEVPVSHGTEQEGQVKEIQAIFDEAMKVLQPLLFPKKKLPVDEMN